MTFNAEEKNEIEKIFQRETYLENLEKSLPSEIFKFLQKRENLRTISDKIIWRDSNAIRPFSSCTVTKFIHENFDISKSLEDLVSVIDFEYLIFADFHFIVHCPAKDTDEKDLVDEIDDSNRVFKFQRGSKASAFNTRIKMSSVSDIKSFISSFKDYGPTDFLKIAFQNHCELFQFYGSDIRPYMLLSMIVHIQKIS